MSDYTPTTEELRKIYTYCRLENISLEEPTESEIATEEASFDRWLTNTQSRTWQEGYREGLHAHQSRGNPYLKKDKK